MRCSIAILAGGSSTRMGRDKALAPLAGKPMIQHQVERLQPLSGHLFIAGGDAAAWEHLGLPVCADQYPIGAALVGVYSALAASAGDGCLVVACDMPFVESRLARLLIGLAPGHDAVVPVSSRGLEPLLAYYSRSCLSRLRTAIEKGELELASLLAELDVHRVSGPELAAVCDPQWTFFNINNPAALEAAEQRLRDLKDAPRVADSLPLICFVGRKNSGKTTLIEKLVPRLVSAGTRVAYIKHDAHRFEMDRPGSDTWRVTQAGASCVSISSPEAVATLQRVDHEVSLRQLIACLDDAVDLVVVEGFKGSDFDRVELHRSGNGGQLLCHEEELVAVISDDPAVASTAPVLDIDDPEEVLGFVIERYGLSPAPSETRAELKQ